MSGGNSKSFVVRATITLEFQDGLTITRSPDAAWAFSGPVFPRHVRLTTEIEDDLKHFIEISKGT